MDEFVYRKANIDDLEPITKLGNLIVDFTVSDTPTTFWDIQTLKNCIEDPSSGLILCAYKDTELVGFSIVLYNKIFKTATFDQLFVLPKYRNFGVGKVLYEQVIENVKNSNIDSISMITEFNNTSVINFFERKGFDKTFNHAKLILNLKEN